jgi:uncharacterized protein YebE (UPF0316 family)
MLTNARTTKHVRFKLLMGYSRFVNGGREGQMLMLYGMTWRPDESSCMAHVKNLKCLCIAQSHARQW